MNANLSASDPHDSRSSAADPRAWLVAQLLDADPARRREALREARTRRWIDMYGEVTVRAVLVDGPLSRRKGLAHTLSVSGRVHTVVIDDTDALIVVTSAARTDLDIAEWIRNAAYDADVDVVAAIGSAQLHADEDDLQRASDDARATSELLMLVGSGTIGTTRAEDLGMWRLLHGMTGSPELVAVASPAAAELWRSPDASRRITVEAYLDAGCSVAIACRALFIHRTTLYYRLESMPDTVRDALADGLQRSCLHLALKLMRLWDVEERPTAWSARVRRRADATITHLHPRQSSNASAATLP